MYVYVNVRACMCVSVDNKITHSIIPGCQTIETKLLGNLVVVIVINNCTNERDNNEK